MKTKLVITILSLMIILGSASCRKKKSEQKIDPRVPPALSFKTTAGYIYADDTLVRAQTYTVGVTATQTEDPLTSFNVSYAYDGSSTTTTFYNYALAANERNSYSKDVIITTRNQNGTEKWIFTIVDKDGNITQKSLNFLVQ